MIEVVNKIKSQLCLLLALCLLFCCASAGVLNTSALDIGVDYLEFEGTQEFTVTIPGKAYHNWNDLEYSDDGIEWSRLNADSTEALSVSSGEEKTLYFRGTDNNSIIGDGGKRWTITTDGKVSASGNIETLLDWKTVEENNHPVMDDHCFESMFYGCDVLISAPDINSVELSDYCCHNMFDGCVSLIKTPKIEATVFGKYSCWAMFYGCVSLTYLPEIKGVTLSEGCFNMMFSGCTSVELNSAEPGTEWKIPAKDGAAGWNEGMFYGTSGSVVAPELNTAYYVTSAIKNTVREEKCVNGSVSVGSVKRYLANEKVSVSAVPVSDCYEVYRVFYDDGTTHEINLVDNSYSFTMPEADVKVSAEFRLKTSDRYDITLFEDDFEYKDTDYIENIKWNVIDSDNDGYNWWLASNNNGESSVKVHSGKACITSESFNNAEGSLTPDNILVLKTPVTIPADSNSAELSFYACGQDSYWCSENMRVYVGTTNDITQMTLLGSMKTTASAMEYYFDLSGYIGQSIYVAIRHFDTSNMFRLNIDDVTITSSLKYTIENSLPSFNSVENHGYLSIDKRRANSGETVTITPVTEEGYKVEKLWYNDGTDHVITTEEGVFFFTMPEKTVKVYAEIIKCVCKLDGVNYPTVADAIKEAGSTHSLITLMSNAYESVTIGENQDIIIDINGFNFTAKGKNPAVSNKGKATFIDSSYSKSGIITSENIAINNSTSSAELHAVDIAVYSSATGVENYGCLKMDKCVIMTESINTDGCGIKNNIGATAELKDVIIVTMSTTREALGISNFGTVSVSGFGTNISATGGTGSKIAAIFSNTNAVLTIDNGVYYAAGGSVFTAAVIASTCEITGDAEFILGKSNALCCGSFMAENDFNISNGRFNGEIVTIGEDNRTVTGGSFTVEPVNYVNTENCYITDNGENLDYRYTVIQRPSMSISAPDVTTHVYDGNEFFSAPAIGIVDGTSVTYEIKSSGQDEYIKCDGTPSIKNAGELYVRATAHNIDYKPSSVEYVLTVTKRSVTLTSDSAYKLYDGNPLTAQDVTTGGDGFVTGEGATWDVTGTQTQEGVSDNTFTYTLNAGTNPDNYNIKTVFGELKVEYSFRDRVLIGCPFIKAVNYAFEVALRFLKHYIK